MRISVETAERVRSWFERLAVALAACAVWILVPGASAAQSTELGTVPGFTDFASDTGDSIQTACGALLGAGRGTGGVPGSTSDPVDDLADRCTDMVVTAQSLLGQMVPNVLSTDAAGLEDAVVSVSSTQAPAQGIQSIDTAQQRFQTIEARLIDVRMGATGLVMKGFAPADVVASRDGFPSSEELWQRALHEDAAAGSYYEDEEDGEGPGRLGAFVHGEVNYGHWDGTDSSSEYDFNITGITGGVDWRFTDILVAGIAFNWRQEDTRYAGNAFTSSLGKLERDSYGGTIYASLFQEGFYADLVGSYSRHEFDIERRIVYGSGAFAVDRTATSSPDADEWSWALGTGWDVEVPGAEGLTIGPLFRAEWVRLVIDDFSESGALGLNLAYDEQTVESFATVLGARMTYALSTPIGVLVPQLWAEWQHEFQNDARTIDVRFENDPNFTRLSVPTGSFDEDWANLGASLTLNLPFNISGYAVYEAIVDYDDLTSHRFTFGFRAAFL